MNRSQAIELLEKSTQSPNLRKHMLAVAACMKGLANYFGEDENMWEVTGIVHDADYEMFKNEPKKHPSAVFAMLEKAGAEPATIQAVRSHAWGWREDLPKPETKLDWSLFCADELAGFITAVTLVQPSKKIADVTVESVQKKWNKKDFAKGVFRKNIEYCEPELGIRLPDFIGICLQAMQSQHQVLGL
jgi:predicted hydrolase (HD superfamily)